MLRPALVIIAVVALATLSSTSLAQRGGGSGRERPRQTDASWDAITRDAGIALKLSNGDVEEMDPVRRLMDKRKDLKLTDDQQKSLKEVLGKTKEATRLYFKTLDSLRQAMRPRAGADADAERARTTLAREAVIGVVAAIRGTYDASLKEALPLLDATQQPKAEELIKKHTDEADETLREKLGGGMGSRGRRGGGPN